MTRYLVCLTRLVEEVATIEVDANTPQEAIKEAEDEASLKWAELNAQPSDYSKRAEAYCVKQGGHVVWEFGLELG